MTAVRAPITEQGVIALLRVCGVDASKDFA